MTGRADVSPAPAALVLFRAGGALCALPPEAVRALLPLPRLDAPPGLPAPLAGFLNLGGEAVPVLDLAILLGLPPGPPDPYRHLILLAAGTRALLVDRVAAVRPEGAPVRPVAAETSLGGTVTGAVETGEGTAHLLDPGRLLLAGEAAILDALTGQARDRLARWTAPEEG